MVENRFSDASEVDMTNAIDKALRTIGGNSFAHFWTDGLVENSENAEEVRAIRRSLLIAIGRALRRHPIVNYDAIWEEFKNAAGLPVESHRFQFTLRDFERRKVLVEDKQGNFTAKIPLFQSWLKDKGVGELLGDDRELEILKTMLQEEEQVRVRDAEILNLCEELKHFRYRGRSIEPMAIRNWLDQFNGSYDQRLMFTLLSQVQVYDEDAIRGKLREAFGIVTRNMRTVIEAGARVRSDILVSSLDESAAKSGLTYCKLFSSENRISSQSVLPLRSLERRLTSYNNVQRLVLIDDFSGTGRTLIEGLKRESDFLRQVNAKGIQIILMALVGFSEALQRVERFIEQSGLVIDVYFCDELGSEHKAFSEDSTVFPDPNTRDRAKQIAEATGMLLERRQPLGYGDIQALVTFSQSCPNNTLPILWSRNNNWTPMFPRI